MPRSPFCRTVGATSLAFALLLQASAGAPGASAVEAHRWSDAQHMDRAAIAELRASLLVPDEAGSTRPLTTAHPLTLC